MSVRLALLALPRLLALSDPAAGPTSPQIVDNFDQTDGFDVDNFDQTDGFEAGDRELKTYYRSSRRRYSHSGSYGHSGRHGQTNGIGAVIMGCIIWCLVPTFLCTNERIAIKQMKLQGRAKRHCVVVDRIDRVPIEDLEGHIVHVSGQSKCTSDLRDKEFPQVRAPGAIKLRRYVEMFQYHEEKDNDNNSDNNSTKVTDGWFASQQHVNEGGFSNPQMPMQGNAAGCDEEAAHGSVTLGVYYLDDHVIRELTFKPMTNVREDQLTSQKLKGPASQNGGWFYFGDPNTIGSIRVKFEQILPGPLTVCGALANTQTGWTFLPVYRDAGNSASETLSEEFGCKAGSCPCDSVHEEPTFGDPEDDEELKEQLEEFHLHHEFTDKEKGKFRRLKSSVDADFYMPERGILSCMGLESEFLGVQEKIMDHEDLMDLEGGNAKNRHCIARVVGMLLGILGTWMIISPITDALEANWFIYMLGGGLISCMICCLATICSLTCSTFIILLAWLKARPRAVAIVATPLILLVVALCVYSAHQETNFELTNTTLAPAIMTLAPSQPPVYTQPTTSKIYSLRQVTQQTPLLSLQHLVD